MDTVAVCDSEPIAIEGLRSLLESSESLQVVAAESSLEDGMDAVRELEPSLLIVDKGFGIRAVEDWLAGMRNSGKPVATIVWANSFSDTEAMRFIQAGAAGVLRKTASLDTVLECFRTVQGGNTWMGGDIVRSAEPSFRRSPSPLTCREAQVMELVERGMKNKDIAAILGIRIGTVKIHLKHIFEKTGIRGRYSLALSGLKEKGLLALKLD